ncbi:hypothetical protein EC957_008158 [Mortierella hygrophila]|uniref:Uncharacterized protein n=1 Tax=Mortierella hygrophila TaxID=979708 RepID=A0A9P6FI00_9FUNG|nr:hypothetical protein EC957_008158 [Mortierella hygrophila]
MDPQQPSKSQNQSRLPHDQNTTTSSTFGSEGAGGVGLGSTAATSTGGTRSTTTAATATSSATTPYTSTSSSSTLLGSIVASARNAAATLDPRQADVLRQHHSFGGGSSSSSSQGGIGSSSSKATTSSASRTFQHTTNALETLGSSSSTSGAGSGTGYSSGFRQPASSTVESAGGMMDWDSFLGSSDSTVQEDSAPYKPPSMASFGFSNLSDPESVSVPSAPPRHDHFSQQPYQQEQGRRQFAEAPAAHSQAPNTYQAHLSQPMNLTPANHAAFLEYLKSTAYPTQSSSASASTTAATASSSAPLSASLTANSTPASATTTRQSPPPQFQHQPYQPYQPYQPPQTSMARPIFSNDIQNQQHHDGGDVLAFLNSTSYSEYVDEIDSAGAAIEKHQHDRREFVYTYSQDNLGTGPTGRSIFSTLQLIQHLPSERQDIVSYLLQQGTYTDDVWSRPFVQDVQSEEGASLEATQAEQDRFLKDQLEGRGGDATEEEMERVLKEIVEGAKEEVKTGQTDGRAVNRLLMVRSHITMGTKL